MKPNSNKHTHSGKQYPGKATMYNCLYCKGCRSCAIHHSLNSGYLYASCHKLVHNIQIQFVLLGTCML